MSLTLAHGPLAMKPPKAVNYRIEGPAHKLWSLRQGEELVPDVAWSYQEPLEDAWKAKDHLWFLRDRLTVEIT